MTHTQFIPTGRPVSAPRRRRINWVRLGGQVLIGVVAVTLFAPNALVALMSFNTRTIAAFPMGGFTLDWWGEMFQMPAVWSAVRLSLLIAVLSTLLSVLLGLCSAWALTRPNFRLKGLLGGMLIAPMVVPYLVVGAALLVFWNNIGVQRGVLTAVLAHTALALPFTALVLAAGMATLDPRLDEAASSLGASRLYTLTRVTLPQMIPSLIAACAFAFTVSFDEFNVTYFVIGTGESTLPIYIYSSLKFGISPSLNAIATLALILSITLAAFAFGRTKRAKKDPS